MNKEEALSFYKQYRDKCNAYQLAETTIFFDMSTIAPENGNDYRIKMMSLLGGEAYDYQTAPENIEKLEEMSKLDLGDVMNEEIRQVLKDLHRISKLPRDFYIYMQELSAKGEIAWKKAKKEKDYSLFKDVLKELVEMRKKAYDYYGYDKTLYDAMLDDYETGMTIEKYDNFFACIKERLVPFIKKLEKEGKKIDDQPLHQTFEIEGQEKVMDILKDYMNFNPKECYMGLSAHPFTCSFSLHDVRITNKYIENSLVSSIFTIIHEYGHALYMMHVDEKLEGLYVSGSMTSGMHESQSRLLENYIGRRKKFIASFYPELVKIFPENLGDVSLETFWAAINVAKPSLIRTDADELTYPLHILIRYEIEKRLFNGELDTKDLNKVWNAYYKEYLGIGVPDDARGILQDIHWSQGDFGYFPTYALGSAVAAQIVHKMADDIDIDDSIDSHISKITDYLGMHIQHYGALYPLQELLRKTSGEKFNPRYYIDYLKNKYRKLYNLD